MSVTALERFPLRPVRELKKAPDSFAPPKARDCPHKGTCDTEDLCNGYQECKLDRTSVEAPRGLDLTKLESELSRNRLEEIAELTGKLTYGEMMTFAAGLWDTNGKQPLTDDMLPVVLHRWATRQERK